jgi:outer membrane protein OmpA-like peptidoglycan-associated protein
MKKMSLLALALVTILPGCCCRKKNEVVNNSRRNMVDRSMDTQVKVTEQDQDGEDDIDLTDLDEDIDYDALVAMLSEDEDNNEDSEDDEDLSSLVDEYSGEEQAFNWVDSSEEDEFKRLYFAFNHYGLKADQKAAIEYDIDQAKQLIAEAGNVKPTIVIEGHACQEGSPAYNLALSEKRAKQVADLFVEAGIGKDFIKVIGRGQETPLVKDGKLVDGSREERSANRRVEVRVIYT